MQLTRLLGCALPILKPSDLFRGTLNALQLPLLYAGASPQFKQFLSSQVSTTSRDFHFLLKVRSTAYHLALRLAQAPLFLMTASS